MIFRRRHTANYTTIGNALFEDERLAADELGILAWLLSRPHDWEVRRPALMRRHHVGRDALKRIITNWMRTGWCHAKKTRLSNGTFHVIYEIRDEPGCEMSDDEIRTALSLVSGGAVGDDSGGNDAADQVRETGDPPTPQPGVDDQGVASRSWPIEDILTTDSENTESTKGVRAFSEVREAWPIEHVLSVVACESLHVRMTDADKDAAFLGVKPYLDDCKAQNRKVCDLATFYRERRWERFAVKAPSSGFFHLRRDTAAQTGRWRTWIEDNEPKKLRMFDQAIASGRGYTVPSEWPPPKGQRESPALMPDSSLTEEDAAALANLK